MDNRSRLLEFSSIAVDKQISGRPLNDFEKLIDLLWITDNSVRYVGYLNYERVLDSSVMVEVRDLSLRLRLAAIHTLFSRSLREIEGIYLTFFDEICNELRSKYINRLNLAP